MSKPEKLSWEDCAPVETPDPAPSRDAWLWEGRSRFFPVPHKPEAEMTIEDWDIWRESIRWPRVPVPKKLVRY